MSTYFLFGKYSLDSMKEISAKRSEKSIALIKEFGGVLKAGYALLGDVDLILIVDLPDTEAAMKLSLGLARMLGVSFQTAPAVTFEEFDKLAGR